MASKKSEKFRHSRHAAITIYRRPGTKNFWAMFHHQGRTFRKTTGTNNKKVAEKVAENWYLDTQAQLRTGLIPGSEPQPEIHTVKDASIVAIQDIRKSVERGDRSKNYLKSLILYLNREILPFLGDVDIAKINGKSWKEFLDGVYQRKQNIADSTVHQIRNALALCLRSAANKGWIDEAPRLRLENRVRVGTPRAWFEPDEQVILLRALDEYAAEMSGTNHQNDALELRDYVKFVLYSGLRKGEAMSLRFCDIRPTVSNGINHIILFVAGKRGEGYCNPDRAIMPVYFSIRERRDPQYETERLFLKYHNDAFNKILKITGLKFSNRGKKRDFISLRHTYISNKLREGVSVFDVAKNCRTSTTMIENHYARWLSPELMDSLHRKSDAEIAELEQMRADFETAREQFSEHLARYFGQLKKRAASLPTGKTNFSMPVESFHFSIPIEDLLPEDQQKLLAEIRELERKYGLK